MTATATFAGRLHAAAMLARIRSAGRRRAPAPASKPVGDVPCDWYPARGPARALVVALHGVTVNGKDDHRLRAFAGALAASGTTCAVPTLPALVSFRWETSDVDAIVRVVEAASDAAGRPAVVVGFSHGASLGLLAAARPAGASRVSHVLGFGAYHSLEGVFARIRALALPARPADRNDVVYARLVEARRRAGALGLPPEVCAAADDLLRRYCDAATDDEKLRFFDAHLRALAVEKNVDSAADATFPAMSPAGKLAGIACAVGLVHDPDDLLVPPSDAEALLAELRRVAPGHDHRLLVTRLVRHVALARPPSPGEAWRLLGMLAPLVGG
ncbi:MAG TPA: alpha/beta hydrolase [Anaeromyxobacter sp.]|nr:alpha/beta hydrolase [Anaeromyxobacter sp.]